ncbi:MAG: 3-isopropylmalate dehydratase small subunit [Candidatus Omnitrophota bacterium]|jgi:3-isopropylmalate/(R)-2-methylmalate dehydratase small subunit
MKRRAKLRKKVTKRHKSARMKKVTKRQRNKETKKKSSVEEVQKLLANQHFARRLKVQDNINTDYVISGRYKFRIQDPKELSKHIFEDIDPEFAARVKNGDILVAGENFGCGSSREQAPQALKTAGFYAVAAKSFARIFYRNAFNIGLLLVECNTGFIDDGDALELDINKGTLKDVSKGLSFDVKQIPQVMRKLLEDGGVVEHFRKYGGFHF